MKFDVVCYNFELRFETINGTVYNLKQDVIVNRTQFLLDQGIDDGILYIFLTGGNQTVNNPQCYAHFEYHKQSGEMFYGLLSASLVGATTNVKLRVHLEDLINENIEVI
jgi:hypothetical protein